MVDSAHIDLSSLIGEDDPEALPSNLISGRAAEPPNEAWMKLLRDSYTALMAGDKAHTVKRFMVPVKASEMSWRDSKRKERDGTETVTKYEQHPNITGVITRLRKAAEAEGLGVRIVVDYDKSPDGNKLRVQKKEPHAGTVRVRFVGINRKQRKSKGQTPTAA